MRSRLASTAGCMRGDSSYRGWPWGSRPGCSGSGCIATRVMLCWHRGPGWRWLPWGRSAMGRSVRAAGRRRWTGSRNHFVHVRALPIPLPAAAPVRGGAGACMPGVLARRRRHPGHADVGVAAGPGDRAAQGGIEAVALDAGQAPPVPAFERHSLIAAAVALLQRRMSCGRAGASPVSRANCARFVLSNRALLGSVGYQGQPRCFCHRGRASGAGRAGCAPGRRASRSTRDAGCQSAGLPAGSCLASARFAG